MKKRARLSTLEKASAGIFPISTLPRNVSGEEKMQLSLEAKFTFGTQNEEIILELSLLDTLWHLCLFFWT